MQCIYILPILLIGPSEGKTNVPTWFYNGISLSKKNFCQPYFYRVKVATLLLLSDGGIPSSISAVGGGGRLQPDPLLTKLPEVALCQPVLLVPVCAWQALSPPGGGAPPPPPPPPPSRGEGSWRRSKDADGRHLESAFQGQVLSLWHRGKSDGSRFLNLIEAAKYHGEVSRFQWSLPIPSTWFRLVSNWNFHLVSKNKDLFLRSLHLLPVLPISRGLLLIQPSANPMTGQPLQLNMEYRDVQCPPTKHILLSWNYKNMRVSKSLRQGRLPYCTEAWWTWKSNQLEGLISQFSWSRKIKAELGASWVPGLPLLPSPLLRRPEGDPAPVCLLCRPGFNLPLSWELRGKYFPLSGNRGFVGARRVQENPARHPPADHTHQMWALSLQIKFDHWDSENEFGSFSVALNTRRDGVMCRTLKVFLRYDDDSNFTWP